MAYLFLIIAIIFEVAGALSLRMATSGSKKKGLWLLAVLGGYLVMLGRNRAIREEQERKVLHLYPEDDWDENYDEELYWEEAPAYAARSV